MWILPVGDRLQQRQPRILCRICVVGIIVLIHRIILVIQVITLMMDTMHGEQCPIIPSLILWIVVMILKHGKNVILIVPKVEIIICC